MNDAIDRIVVKLFAYREEAQKKTILLTGCSSGNGTTTVAINLAIALADAGWNTLLVDSDMRKSMEFKRLNSKASGLSDFLNGDCEADSVVCPTNQANLHYVQCGSHKTNIVRLLCSERMKRFITGAREAFDFVVFDCPSLTIVPDATILFPSVDCITLVLTLDSATKKQFAKAKMEIQKHNDKYAGIIVNRVDRRQYRDMFPQNDYFQEKILRKKYKRFLKASTKARGR